MKFHMDAKGGVMKRLTLGVCILLSVVLTAIPLAAQGRGGGNGSSAGRGAPAGATSTSAVAAAAGYAASASSSGSYASGAIGNRAFGTGIYPSTNYGGYTLKGTSFTTTALYYDWNNYYAYLYRYYSLSPAYLTRFYRNREPLMTPAMLKLVLREPMFISTEMLKTIDQLEMMLRSSAAGLAVDKEDLIAKSRAIRTMAKQIRQNQSLSMIDLREDTDLYKNIDFDVLSLESIGKLREMALSLNNQLGEMYKTSSSSTISVESYQEPSLESVAKGIERVCKAIEKSSKRL
jgi:hypothetical protein